MTKDNEKYQAYVQILNEELIPAMGCTEPIALAYAAAKAREVLVPFRAGQALLRCVLFLNKCRVSIIQY